MKDRDDVALRYIGNYSDRLYCEDKLNNEIENQRAHLNSLINGPKLNITHEILTESQILDALIVKLMKIQLAEKDRKASTNIVL